MACYAIGPRALIFYIADVTRVEIEAVRMEHFYEKLCEKLQLGTLVEFLEKLLWTKRMIN